MKLKNPVLQMQVDAGDTDLLTYILQDAGAIAIEERDGSTMTAASAPVGCVELVAGFEDAAIRDAAKSRVESLDISVFQLTEIDEMDDDWQTRWREFFKPVVLTKLQIVTPWMSLPRKDLMAVVIDPGQAFGTGGHATTKLILEMLESLSDADGLPNRVLDVGTGSGILAFAARKLGAERILGVDIDPESVTAFQENAERNNIDDGVQCRLGTASDADGVWPLVMANIQIDAFRICASDVAARVQSGGRLLLSGILIEQVEECLALFPGFSLNDRANEGEWAALALLKTP